METSKPAGLLNSDTAPYNVNEFFWKKLSNQKNRY